MPYLTGGVTADWTGHLRAMEAAGADAIELGLPFSDPTLDGATIQEASDTALARGATPDGILAELRAADVRTPIVASTYANLVLRKGAGTFAASLREAGVRGLIVPDLPLEEVDEVSAATAGEGIDLALLASPVTPSERLRGIADRSRGFVYAVSVMGTTGERAVLADSAERVAQRLREVTDRPVFLGFGITTPEQAAAAAQHADGVIVGAAVMRRVLDGARPAETGAFVAALRAALDEREARIGEE
ncbi:MAG: tryptophan synthase subunit alpha [Hamadaea sp.]|nr:tryptophan synthase subunit alpha [Hamadaea sp.]